MRDEPNFELRCPTARASDTAKGVLIHLDSRTVAMEVGTR